MGRLSPALRRAAALAFAFAFAWLVLVGPAATPSRAAASLASGIDHTCGVTAAKGLACWGRNLHGELGTGDRLPRDRATPVPGLSDVTGVAAVNFQTCAIAGGKLLCWGDPVGGPYSVLRPRATTVADQAGVDRSAPIPGVTDGVDVAMASQQVCVLRVTGAVRCMQLGGPGHRERRLVAQTGLGHVLQLAAGVDHLCARLRGGAVRCWGDRPEVDRDGSITDRRRAPGVAVPALRGATSLGLSLTSTCGARKHGTVRCFGEGQRKAKTLRNVRGVRTLSSGQEICALKAGGALQCLGYDGREAERGSAVGATPPLTGVTAAAQADGHTCAQRTTGEVLCWGDHTWALGSGQAPASDAAVEVPGLTGVTAISAAGSQTCALRADHTVACWGDANLNRNTGLPSLTPTTIPGVTDAASISTSDSSGCSVGLSGEVRCWGVSYAGFYDPSVVLHRAAPGAVMSSALGCIAGAGHVECLGPTQPRGRSQTIIATHADAPKWMQGATNMVTTDDADVIFCGTFPDRSVTCSVYQEGDPGVYYDEVRTKVPGFTDVTSVVASSLEACALRGDHTVVCWSGYDGGRNPSRDVPALAGATAIALDGSGLCGVVAGRVRCTAAEHRAGSKTEAAVLEIQGVTDAIAVGISDGGGCALRAGGTVACWGTGDSGQLGDGPMPGGHGPTRVPIPVVGFTGPAAVAAG